jgi:hypothetical protein
VQAGHSANKTTMQVNEPIIASFTDLTTKGVKKVTSNLRGKLRPQIENIQSCAKDVKKAIALAKAISDRKNEQFQEQERKLAAKHRKQLSIFVSQSQKELETAREWQMQRDQDLLSKFQKLYCISYIDENRGEENETPGLFVNIRTPNKLPSDSQKAAYQNSYMVIFNSRIYQVERW